MKIIKRLFITISFILALSSFSVFAKNNVSETEIAEAEQENVEFIAVGWISIPGEKELLTLNRVNCKVKCNTCLCVL